MPKLRSYLSEDIVIDILLRLPVKSLLEFMTVSKSWLSIISDSQFVQSHYCITGQKKTWILASETLRVTPRYFGYIFMPKHLYSCRIISTCNGIVCLVPYYNDGLIYLWNPSIKKYKRLPTPKTNSRVSDKTIKFGYDSISNDFKILCIHHRSNDSVKSVKLFSTNRGFWRDIQVHNKLPRGRYSNDGLVINGVVYFEVEDEKNDENVIISFDLHNEIFKVVQLPSCIQKRVLHATDSYEFFATQKRRSNLLDFEGSLAIILVDSIDDGSVHDEISLDDDISVHQGISVWTLKDDGEVSWIKKISIGTEELSWLKKVDFHSDFWIDIYLGNGKFYGRNILPEFYSPGYHIVSHMWYDYKKKQGNCFELDDEECPDQVLKYTESLVSFKGFKSIGQSTQLRKKRRTPY